MAVKKKKKKECVNYELDIKYFNVYTKQYLGLALSRMKKLLNNHWFEILFYNKVVSRKFKHIQKSYIAVLLLKNMDNIKTIKKVDF